MKKIVRNARLPLTFFAAVFVAVLVSACGGESVSRSPVGHRDGTVYLTFTESLPRVSTAALAALDRMGIKVEAQENTEKRHTIQAKTGDLNIEVQLDAISPASTRMQTTAKSGLLSNDQATATEIALQTEKTIREDWSLWR